MRWQVSGNPITFTSTNDNSVGGDTGTGSPAAGDWNGIDLSGSGSLDLQARSWTTHVIGDTSGDLTATASTLADSGIDVQAQTRLSQTISSRG